MVVKFKFKKGDQVVVISGRSKGKKGAILKLIKKDNKLLVSGVNLVTLHKKPSASNQGGRITKESPIDLSNVAHIDPKSGNATKIGYKILENGKKVRFAKKSGEVIDK
ncbi:MAG: 50S ribosomal protein L24 [Alphaproteobacteria bacterium]